MENEEIKKKIAFGSAMGIVSVLAPLISIVVFYISAGLSFWFWLLLALGILAAILALRQRDDGLGLRLTKYLAILGLLLSAFIFYGLWDIFHGGWP